MRPLSRLSLAALAACLAVTALPAVRTAQASGVPAVRPEVETPALFDDEAGGGANGDDPAIWVHPTRPGRSVVVATAKEGGLYAYDLRGRLLQHVPAPAAPGRDDEPGRFNNGDIVYGFGGRDLAVVSDRGRDQIRFYAVDPARAGAGRAPLTDVTDPAAPFVFNTTQEQVNKAETAYGLAAWKDSTGTYVLVSQRHRTTVALLKLKTAPGGRIGYDKVRQISLPSSFDLPGGATWSPCLEPDELPQVEGMVVDVQRDVLYAAQETVGIWRMRADLTGEPVLMDKVRGYGVPGTYDPGTEECTFGEDPGLGGEHLTADAEGLTIYYRAGGKGYLLASSQGDDTFSVYRREGSNAHLGRFRVRAAGGVDGVEHSDGAMVLNVPLGGEFDKGVLVVHDGANLPADGDRENTNFKFVGWDEVADLHDLAVDTDGWHPRR
ncbi:phytase [Planomonospora venezuelensis]|uniref:3-phytase n=1 Tax=Planomonospora venezuelensis TaxID=1999 RepID=A0A841DDY0_PLAVE|nr:phytase [Planomonospora venezuelensis]MBB5966983.1 3-phytase [Planomonospora venezuelensis]GIN01548.1 hydrolase [Planomonospora venezuelensis]